MFYILFLVLAASECPEGTHYYYDQEFNTTIKKNEWYYFFTNIPKDENVPLIMSIKSEYSVKAYAGDISACPNGTQPAFLEVPGGPRYVRGFCKYRNTLHMIAIGIFATENTRVFVKLEGQHQVKKSNRVVLKLIITLITMLTITGIFFIKIVLPNEMKKNEKVE